MRKLFLPLALMGVFALSRLPGCLPANFSAAYALMFCAGVYFPGRLAWWPPGIRQSSGHLSTNGMLAWPDVP